MGGVANYPTALDDDSSLLDVVDGVTPLVASHHNNTKEAVKRIEAKLGIYNTSAPTSLDYRLGHPTGGHIHNGASGQGAPIDVSQLDLSEVSGVLYLAQLFRPASAVVGSLTSAPLILGRTLQIMSVQGGLRRGPSGATTAFDININGTSIWYASQGFRPIFPPGATAYRSSATPNTQTYPSGAVITLDIDAVGSNDPGQDLSINFVFKG